METAKIKSLTKHIARVIFVVENNESVGISLWDSYDKFIYGNGYAAGAGRNSNYLSMTRDYIDETVYDSAKATLLFREYAEDLPDDIVEKVSGLFVIKQDNGIYAVNSNGNIIATGVGNEVEKLFNQVCHKYGFLIDIYCETTPLYNEDGYNGCGTKIGDFTIYGNEESAIRNSDLEAFYDWSKDRLPPVNKGGYIKFNARIMGYEVSQHAKKEGIVLDDVDNDCINAAIEYFWDYTILEVPRFKTVAIGHRKGKDWFIIEQGGTCLVNHQESYVANTYVDLDELRAAQEWIENAYNSVLDDTVYNATN